MRTIALVSQKGGVGKTTLTINLAAAAHAAGQTALAIDTDPQQSTYEWYRARKEQTPMPYVAYAFPENLSDVLARARRNEADFAFIDTSPNSTDQSLAIADQADLLVVPCAPSFIDLRALKRTEKVIRLSEKPAFAVLNLCPSYGDETTQAAEALTSLGFHVCPHRIVSRAATRRAYAVDQSVFDYEPDGKAAQEFQAVYKFTMSHESMSTREHEKEAAHV